MPIDDLKTPLRPRGMDAVAWWLWTLVGMIFIMAVVGAITRLTESGLSIMEWEPLSGSIPPLSQARWQEYFALYQTIDEFKVQWQGEMTLDEFKNIFWWEWGHRQWGRLIGLVAIFGLIFLWARGKMSVGMRVHGVVIILGLIAQGALGWFMVASGFMEGLTDVSSVRLAMHLSLALILYAYVFLLAMGQTFGPLTDDDLAVGGEGLRWARIAVIALMVVLSITIISGALVAGSNAGVGFNGFPLMASQLFPLGYWDEPTWWDVFTKNVIAIQFNHRLMATISLVSALGIGVAIVLQKRRWGRRLSAPAHAVAGWVVVQYILGVATLLMSSAAVPVSMGALHQAGAIVLLSLLCWLTYALFSQAKVTSKSQ